MMEFRNATRTAGAAIDVEINHPDLGWIPFTADPDDTAAGFDVAALVAAVEAQGGIAPYVSPPVPVPASVSRFQARAALLQAGLLQQAETIVAGADALTQMAWADARTFERQSPTIAGLAGALGLDDAGLDALFIAAAEIVA